VSGLRWVVAIVGGAVVGGALAWVAVRERVPGPGVRAAAPRVATGAVVAEPGGVHSPFALLAEGARPGVVNVHTSKTLARSATPFSDVPPPLRPFLGLPPAQPEAGVVVPSLGSGFVISSDGEILTNNHVVEGVDRIRVVFSDKTESDARVVGQDPETDLALIRVERREGLHPLPLGDSGSILPGDWVVAIGNPFGLDHTVTVGIVSAKGRDIGQGRCDAYIQTDAAMNPGNSGGPLLDMRGEVVGINAAINPEANTIGFAVPIDVAKEILPQLRTQGHVTRGWLGVAVQPLTPEVARALGLDEALAGRGALVAHVRRGGPADAAGIRRGDVIVAYQGRPFEELRALPCAVLSSKVGETVAIDLLRDGAPLRVEVTMGVVPAAAPPPAAAVPEPGGAERWGLDVQELTPPLARRLGVDEPGVVVARVEPDGMAAHAGLRAGDVIVEVNRRPVASIADFAAALEPGDRPALLLVRRGEASVFVLLARSQG
jgi:serine protease Do